MPPRRWLRQVAAHAIRRKPRMPAFVFNAPKSLVFRPGATGELGALAEGVPGVRGARVLLATDPGIGRLGLARPAISALEAAGAAGALAIYQAAR
jgi:hypothetical protein